VSDERLDALAETARNRGLKLVRSRVRTPGKRRFGKVGLTDKSGKAVFGMDAKGPTAKPEDVEDYLRNLGAKDWGASLDVAVLARKRKPTKIARSAANDTEPEPDRLKKSAKPFKRESKDKREPKPKPPPIPKVRAAKPSDAKALTQLIKYLGHEIDEKTVRKNLTALKKTGEIPLVATLDKKVVGMCGVGRRIVIHRPAPLGRITALVVAEEAQGKGIGKLLVEEVERLLERAGCKIIEVTSNDRRAAAHAFYRHLGYERTSIRFMKKL
jgi:ribosomal protein S18 acetylase RimI-like enzyme